MSQTKSALIIGASRGLGLGLVRQLRAEGWQVTATVRDPQRADELRALPGVVIAQVDIDDGEAVDALQQRLHDQVFDLLVVNAGISGPQHQSVGAATQAELGQLFMTNAVAPVRLAERFAMQVREGSGTVAFMSSILGSIAGNDSSYLALYKASKAALNCLSRGFHGEQEQSERHLTVLSLHPGWVRTDMGGSEAPLDVPTSCSGLVQQIALHGGSGKHLYIDYEGTPLPW
ncbi:SDR family oxidoreductase [Pseudomonas cavernae]|uniref:SDR family oxidoreductase n=1 Tax=Pseudomonas cavernae TaxID=2320867 RepID=A0A385YX74_9PSED|nr:SDR family oxidoreductase [Pseudomonas cavernae]AYC31499.1 SDR family oxidoreductase [Pseudomonas cavernae]